MRAAILMAAGLATAVVLTPDTSSACGIKSIGMANRVSYSDQRTAPTKGQIAVYGKTRVNRRLALALKASGHRLFRTRRAARAGASNIVLTSAELAPKTVRDLAGTNAVIVVVLAAGESAPKTASYVVRQADRVYVQIAMLEKALRDQRT